MELLDLVKEQFPEYATVLTVVVFVVIVIIHFPDYIDLILNFIKKLFDYGKALDYFYYKPIRKNYNKVLSDHDFLKWQTDIMKAIYNPLIEERNKQLEKHGTDIRITSLEFEDSEKHDKHKYEYESVTMKLPEVSYPFTGVCPKNQLTTIPKLDSVSIEELDRNKETEGFIISEFKKQVKHYYDIIKATIRHPRRLGYMLGKVEFEDDGHGNHSWFLKAYTSVYEHNVKTSHVLEYELYKLYQSVNHIPEWTHNIDKMDKKTILKKLPIREQLHNKFKEDGDESKILTSGKYRASLLGVQAFVLIKNRSGSYDALRIRRSEAVSAKPGFLQFVPSGGFESMNDCTDFDSEWDNYSIVKAIFRELLEECFGQDEDDKHASRNNASPDRLYSNENITRLVTMLENHDEDKPNAEMALLGTTMSLVGLRTELSFILRVDDPSFSGNLIANYESETAIHLVDIQKLENHKFWAHSKDENDLENLNSTSAGLFELARESRIYKDALKKCR